MFVIVSVLPCRAVDNLDSVCDGMKTDASDAGGRQRCCGLLSVISDGQQVVFCVGKPGESDVNFGSLCVLEDIHGDFLDNAVHVVGYIRQECMCLRLEVPVCCLTDCYLEAFGQVARHLFQ